MTENTIQPATVEKNLLEQAADFLGGANRAKKASFASEGSGQALEKVAFRLGYQSLAAFSRAFKRITGQPPGALRATAR